MAFPAVQSVTPTVVDTSGTAHVTSMPATVNSGDLLVAVFGGFQSATVAAPSGWNLLHQTDVSSCVLAHYYRIANGTEGGTTVDFVSVGNTKAVAQVYRITGWHGTTPPEVGTATSGATANPDSPTLTPSWGAADTLWLASFSTRAIVTVSVYPTSYTDGTASSTGSGNAGTTASARRNLNATSDDPSAFTKNGVAAWIAQTVAVRPAAASTQNLTGTLFTKAPTFPTGALTQAPAAPANLTATGTSQTTVDVAWDNVANETGFRIERSLTGAGSWVTAGTNAANDLTFTDTGRSCGTTYFYRVFATNAVGDSVASNTDSAVTDACPPAPPSTGGNRMGGSGAIRKPPRHVGR